MRTWSYGITTVPQRRTETLPATLASLRLAGFDRPTLFIDGAIGPGNYSELGLEYTTHFPAARTFGNWLLSAWELYLRNPCADYYALFQDDILICRNVRQYVEHTYCHPHGYLNLYNVPMNEEMVPGQGWYESKELENGPIRDGKKPQCGRGALALVFDRDAFCTLLQHNHMLDKPRDQQRGWRSVDGAIVTAMNDAGYREYVHYPSLVQHIIGASSMRSSYHRRSTTFRGEDFDAMTLLSRSE